MSEETNTTPAFAAKIENVEKMLDGWVARAFELFGNLPWAKWLGIVNRYVAMFLPVVIALAGVCATIAGLVTAVKYDMPAGMALKTLWVLVLTVFSLHLAPKALALARSLVERSEAEAIRPEFLYILKVAGGLGGVVYALYQFLQFDKDAVVPAFVALGLAALVAIVCTNPGLAGVKAETPKNVVEEVFAIFLLPFKTALALISAIVGVAAAIGLVRGVCLLFSNGFAASIELTCTALLPLLVPVVLYLVMLLALFIVDLCRALARIPGKLDEVKAVAGRA